MVSGAFFRFVRHPIPMRIRFHEEWLASRQTVRAACAGLFLLAAWAWAGPVRAWCLSPAPAPLAVTWVDVGQGLSLVARTRAGQTLVIDTGRPEAAEGRLLPFLDAAGARTVDCLVLTHLDADHAGGLPALAARTRRVLTADAAALRARFPGLPGGLDVRDGGGGQTVEWAGGLALEILYAGPFGKNNPARGMAGRLRFGGFSLLWTGDLLPRQLPPELAGGGKLASGLLQVAHHGARQAAPAWFLKAVSPRLAVVSCGLGNPFGHPAPETTGALRRFGVRWLRTDVNGTVRVETDGAVFHVFCQRGVAR